MNTTTHIAGLAVRVGSRIIQRCSLCGEKLCDSLGMCAAYDPETEHPTFPLWETGCLVRITNLGDGCESSKQIPHPNGDKLPEDNCLPLVEC